MIDTEIVEAIIDKAWNAAELHEAREHNTLRAEIVRALEAKQRQIDRLQSDLNTMSGIMREYSQGFFNVCEQIKAMEANRD